MAENLRITCFGCGTEIVEATGYCPVCKVLLTICEREDCGQAYPSNESACPRCGETNLFGMPFEEEAPPLDRTTILGSGNESDDPSQRPWIDNHQEPANDWEQEFAEAFGAQEVDPPKPLHQTPVPERFQEPSASLESPEHFGSLEKLVDPLVPKGLEGLGGLPLPFDGAQGAWPMIGDPADPSLPIILEVLDGGGHRCEQKGLVQFRVRGVRISEDVQIRLQADSELFPSSVQQSSWLSAGHEHVWDALKFVPKVSGKDEIRLTLTLETAQGVPVGRWSASWIVKVAESATNSNHNNTPMNAGGDIIIMGGSPALPDLAMPEIPNLFGLGSDDWQPLTLRADRALESRLARTRPTISQGIPSEFQSWPSWPSNRQAIAAVHLKDLTSGVLQTFAVVIGSTAKMGRGGVEDVAWWLRPEPYDALQHGRLSRRHLSLELRSGRVWAIDDSGNGSLLNNSPMERRIPALLADGDVLDPARVVPMVVRLTGDGRSVRAVQLERTDGLAGRLGYVLMGTERPIFHVVLPDASIWMAWGADQGRALKVVLGPSGPSLNAPPGRFERLGDRFEITWNPLKSPAEQQQLLVTA